MKRFGPGIHRQVGRAGYQPGNVLQLRIALHGMDQIKAGTIPHVNIGQDQVGADTPKAGQRFHHAAGGDQVMAQGF